MNVVLIYILANSFFWIFVHFASSYLVHFFPESIYNYKNIFFRKCAIEFDGKLYKKLFLIDRWKDKIPEAGTLLGLHPFSKRHFISKNPDYIKRFILETCRGELAHLLPFLFYPISLIWNPFFADIIMFFYVLFTNLPFIIVQRYNRIRLIRLLEKF